MSAKLKARSAWVNAASNWFMGTKNNPGQFDCYVAAEPDEPMFVLLARDASAPLLVREWANMREGREGTNPAKIAEARKCSYEMEDWAHSHRSIFPKGDPSWLDELRHLRAFKQTTIDEASKFMTRQLPPVFIKSGDDIHPAPVPHAEHAELEARYAIACGAVEAMKRECEAWKENCQRQLTDKNRLIRAVHRVLHDAEPLTLPPRVSGDNADWALLESTYEMVLRG